jgi:AraC-like DNA-binding protein
MTDPFAEVVALLQPSLPFSKQASGSGAWRVDRDETGHPMFCVVLEGAARLSVQGGAPVGLYQDDFVLIPAAFGFVMSSTDMTNAASADLLAVTRRDDETRHGDPDGPPNMRMLVGRLAFGSPDAALLVSLFPSLIYVRGVRRLVSLVQLIREEARDDKPAREMILARLLEVLLIEALRCASESEPSPGLLRGLADARLAAAIRRMHEDPKRDWTIQQLAREASLSRSVFFDRFRKAVGISPMEYLMSWRMALAKNLLRQGDCGIKEVAEEVGYGSASAFSTAFTRFVGMPPTDYARANVGPDGHIRPAALAAMSSRSAAEEGPTTT